MVYMSNLPGCLSHRDCNIYADDAAFYTFAPSKGATTSLSGRGGLEDFFSADYFFQLMLKLDFFHTPFEAKVFHKEWKVSFLKKIVMLGRQPFLSLCRSDRFFFFFGNISKPKKKFQHTGWAKLIFSAKSSGTLFFQKSSSRPPPPHNEMVAPYKEIVMQRLQDDMLFADEWVRASKLSLHADKTVCMLITSGRSQRNISNGLDLVIKDTESQQV